MKVKQIINIYKKLEIFSDKRLPIRISYAISRNMKIAYEICQSFDNSRTELLEKYGAHDENGELVVDGSGRVKLNDSKKFADEIDELLDVEEEINFVKISLDDLQRCDSDNYDPLTPNEITVLDMIVDHENEGISDE